MEVCACAADATFSRLIFSSPIHKTQPSYPDLIPAYYPNLSQQKFKKRIKRNAKKKKKKRIVTSIGAIAASL